MRSLCTALFLTRLKGAVLRTPGAMNSAGQTVSGPSRGFTLIEILLALSLISILAGSLYATYAAGIQIHKRAQKIETWSRAAFWSFDAMALDLENMLPYRDPDAPAETPDDFFEGTSSGLKLLRASEAGFKEVRYFLKDPDYGTVHKVIVGRRATASHVPVHVLRTEENLRVQLLVREERAFPSEDGQTDVPLGEGLEILNRYVLKDSLKFFFAEVTRGSGQDDVHWETAWKKTAFPSLVRVEMTLVNPQSPEETVDLQKDIFIPSGAWK